jgi:hypothetical protein
MKLFQCQACGQVLYFENTRCERCGRRLGFLPDVATLSALEPAGAAWAPLARGAAPQRFCANAEYDACNWLVPEGSATPYCRACRHNRVVPDLGISENVLRWRTIETAKHRLIYTLLRLRLPLATRAEDPEHGLAFDFLAETDDAVSENVMTGHASGVITIALAEADDAERERRRAQMHEPYRTLLGHFRHEAGHHVWDLLVRDSVFLEGFRALFGDERADYGAALARHYAAGAPTGWRDGFISAYATAHPWEDWAETFAHYLHMIDTLEMARAFGLRVDPMVTRDPALTSEVTFDPHAAADVAALIEAWLPLTFALNSLNRTMGEKDLYPFVISPRVVEKLGFVCRMVHARAA